MPMGPLAAPRLYAIAVGLACAATLGGCDSGPTLPLPPPSALVSAPDADGIVKVQVSAVPEGALVQAYNVDTGRGVIAEALGPEVELRLEGSAGDTIQTWYRQGTDTSELSIVRVPGGGDAGAPPDDGGGG